MGGRSGHLLVLLVHFLHRSKLVQLEVELPELDLERANGELEDPVGEEEVGSGGWRRAGGFRSEEGPRS